MSDHSTITNVHREYYWTYANKTAREAATGFVAADVGRNAWQTDNKTVWKLLATTPTWGFVSGDPANLAAVSSFTSGDKLVVFQSGVPVAADYDDLPAGGGGLFASFAQLEDQKAQNTDGGTFTSGARRTRDIAEIYDPDGIVSVAANQFTLQAGTYLVIAFCPGHKVSSHQAYLYNVTDTADVKAGSSVNSGASSTVTNLSIVVAPFTIADAKVFEIQHECAVTAATVGFGPAANLSTEVYTIVQIYKFA